MGIPNRDITHSFPIVSTPSPFEFGVHRHLSEGAAGDHFDLRIGDRDTGHAHSWALRYLPEPGETRLAVRQPTHEIGYMDFKGRIESGYGRGKVELARRGQAEVLHASPKHVRFNIYEGKGAEEYLLRQTDGNKWILRNVTPTRQTSGIPPSKPKYKAVEPEELDLARSDTVLQAKVDGAHVLYSFPKAGTQARVFSYRPTERRTGIIEHTHRLPDFQEKLTPPSLSGTLLRGELYAASPSGEALPPARVGGILNAGVWKSRKKQQQEGQLVPLAFDVLRWKGKDVSDKPYRERLSYLAQAVEEAPWLRLPRTAHTEKDKKSLFADIRNEREPSTKEGVVEWHLNSSAAPTKAKFRPEVDVFVKRVFPEQGSRGLAGGFEYAIAPSGPVVGRVGTGFSHALKKDMLANPSKYEGLAARIKVIRGHEGRAPAFLSWHLDQDIPTDVKMAGVLSTAR